MNDDLKIVTTKKRSPNWSREELAALIHGYKDRIDAIDGKITTNVSIDPKMIAYNEILMNINAVSSTGGRTIGQVKKQLADLKCKAKKISASIAMGHVLLPPRSLRPTSMDANVERSPLSSSNIEIINEVHKSDDKCKKTVDYNPKAHKRQCRKVSTSSSCSDNTHNVEQASLEISRKIVALKSLKLRAYLKKLQAKTINVSDEINELELVSNNF